MLYSVMFCHGPNKGTHVDTSDLELYAKDQDAAELFIFMAQFPVGSTFEVSTSEE